MSPMFKQGGSIVLVFAAIMSAGAVIQHKSEAVKAEQDVIDDVPALTMNAVFICKYAGTPSFKLDNVTGFTVADTGNVFKWELDTKDVGTVFYIQGDGKDCQLFQKD